MLGSGHIEKRGKHTEGNGERMGCTMECTMDGWDEAKIRIPMKT